ncbi:MAG: 2-amino-4-hydroxy-6-hydroxymethyldihydropteridine diphosphokinase [Bacteroidales bacterium]
METVYLSLGSNLGDREKNLSMATSLIVTQYASYLGSDIVESSIIETEPWGFKSDNKFLNQVIGFDVETTPEKLLEVCKWVEKKLGRDDKPEYDSAGNRIYHSRTIDVDILLYGDMEIREPNLQIPHAKLFKREFALKPLEEIVSANLKPFLAAQKEKLH